MTEVKAAVDTSDAPLALSFSDNSAPGEIAVDLDRLLRTRLLVQAASGGGKGYLGRFLLENTAGRVQQFVIDPEGEFATLREKFPFVLASADAEGDVPARPESAAGLCRSLMEMEVSAIMDLSELELPQRRRFVRLFLEELNGLGKNLWHPLVVLIDEAHRFAPERGSGEAESTDAIITLASQGRKRGFCLAALTTRLSKLHKDVAADLLNVFVGMTGLDVDVSRAADALGFDKRRKGELRDLDNEFFAYGPALPSRKPVRVKAGAVQTTHPDYGGLSGGVGPAPPAPEEIRSLLADLARSMEDEAPAEGSAFEEKGEEDGRGRSSRRKGADGDVEAEVRRRVHERLSAEVEQVAGPLRERIGTLESVVGEASTSFATGVAVLERAGVSGAAHDPEDTKDRGIEEVHVPETPKPEAPEPEGRPPEEEETAPAAEPPADEFSADATSAEETKPANKRDGRRRILGALAHLESLGISPVPRATLAAHAGFKPSKDGGGSGTFRDYLAEMGREDLLFSEAGSVRLGDKGRALAARLGAVHDGPRTLAEFHDRLASGLPQKAAEMLRAVIAHHPDGISREDLAEECGVTMNGTTRGYLADFGRLGLITSRGGRVRSTERLFPEGLS